MDGRTSGQAARGGAEAGLAQRAGEVASLSPGLQNQLERNHIQKQGLTCRKQSAKHTADYRSWRSQNSFSVEGVCGLGGFHR